MAGNQVKWLLKMAKYIILCQKITFFDIFWHFLVKIFKHIAPKLNN